MKVEDAQKIAAKVKTHKELLEKLWRMKAVKEFTNVTFEGEDGAERTGAFQFKGDEAKKIYEFAMNMVREELAAAEKEIESL